MRLLGKTAAQHDTRTLKLADYLVDLPAVKASCTWMPRVSSWGMYGNDTCGDCTIAAAFNMIRCWTANGQLTQVGMPDELALKLYGELSGWLPSDPLSDTGLPALEVLKFWKNTGLGTRKILAFMSINPFDVDEMKLAIQLFGGIYAGMQLPLAFRNDLPIWTAVTGADGEPGSWGGHAAPLVAFDADGLTAITWAAPQPMTWSAWMRYADEAYAILSLDFLTNGQAPNGLDLDQLEHDLLALRPPLTHP